VAEYTRQWGEQEAGPKKVHYGPPQILEWAGPMLPVYITLPWELEEELRRRALSYPPPVSGIAIIDTGASSSGFDESVIRKLALQPTDVQKSTTAATGRRLVRNTYSVRLSFPHTSLPDFPVPNAMPHRLSIAPHFVPKELNGKVIALLGRDFLRHFTLTYEGTTGKFTLAWSGV
jgi:hypothetical protein